MDDVAVWRGTDMILLPGSRSPLGPDRLVPKGRHGHPREEIRSLHRARLLDAFVDVVGRVGYDNTRVADVCQRAGVSNRAFYSAFADKEDCYLAAFDLGAHLLVEQAKLAYQSTDGTWGTRLRAGMETIMAYLAANPAFARFCTIEPPRVGPVAVDHLNTIIEDCRHALSGSQPANVPPALQHGPLGSLLVGAVFRPMSTYIEDGRTEELPSLVPSLVDFLLLVVAGGGDQGGQATPGPAPAVGAHSAVQ